MTSDAAVMPTAQELLDSGARSLLLTFADNSGAVRAKYVPGARIASVAARGLGISPLLAVMGARGALTRSPHYGGPAGDMRLLPDLAAATCIDTDSGMWWAPVGQYSQDLHVMPCCQRDALRRRQAAAEAAGLRFSMAFELEFTVLAGDRDAPTFAHQGPPYSLNAFLELEDFLVELTDQLAACGLEPEPIHPEYGPGQVEFALAPASPVAAADRQVLARLVTHRVARRLGLRVSFSPVVAAGALGNGCHIHLSARTDQGNVFAGDGEALMTDAGAAAIAGLIGGLPEATGLLAGSVLSYERLIPGHFAGVFSCWGIENRECAVRFIPGTVTHRDAAANCEVKVADCTCNPYLAAAALMAMALDGVRKGAAPPPPVADDPQFLSEQEKLAHGVRRLPTDLETALRALEKSSLMREALGDEVVDAVVAVRRAEAHELADFDLDAKIAALRWLY